MITARFLAAAAAVALLAAPAVAAEPAPFALLPPEPPAPVALPGGGLSAGDAGLLLGRGEAEFRRKPAVSGDLLRLEGEHVVRRLPIVLTAAEAGRAVAVELGAVTAIDVLETLSSIEVFLNGTLIETLRPRFDAPATMRARIEPGQVVAGVNELMIVARHEHRIDCSLAGTYQLWTRILPEQTGIIFSRAPTTSVSVAELPGILGSSSDPSALAIVAPSPFDDEGATRLVRLANAVVLNGWMPRPRVRPAGTAADVAEGLRLRLAAQADSALVPFSDVDGLYLELGADDTPAGLVLAGDAARVEAALAELEGAAARRMPSGSARGVAALLSHYGTVLADETEYSFGALAFDDLSFAGRHARVDLATVLPPDFFQADYGDLRLYLDGAVPAGLVDGSMLKVKVNDIETVTLPLASARPTEFRQRELRLPLDMFHAGLNTLTLEADLIAGSDETCAPEAAPVVTPRLEIRASSRLVTPKFARVGVTPNLSATFGHAYPYVLQADKPTRVFLVGERSEAFAAAAAFLAQMTANAQRVVPFEVALRRPTQAEAGIIIGTAGSMPDWAQPLLGTADAAAAAPTPEPAAAAAIVTDTTTAGAPLDVVRQRFTVDPAEGTGEASASPFESLGTLARDGLATAEATVRDAAGTVATALLGSNALPRARLYTAADVVLAQAAAGDEAGVDAVASAVLPSAPPRTWTLVATPDAASLERALAGPSELGVRFQPHGAHYAYDGARDRVVEAGEDATLFATQTPGVLNLRLVAAGWLSHNPKVYVAVVLATVLMAGLCLLVGVRRTRSGHDR